VISSQVKKKVNNDIQQCTVALMKEVKFTHEGRATLIATSH